MKTFTYFKTSIGIPAIAILTTFTAKAQITIHESDFAQIGDRYIIANDTNPTVTPGSAGANVSWNLSGLKNDKADTEFALSPSATPYFSYFPTSNLALRTDVIGLGESDEFDNLGPDSITAQGTIVPFGVSVDIGTYTPSFEWLVFPATYNEHWSGSTRNVEKYSVGGGDSVKGVILYTYTTTIDGWGTITTPAGSYNALRENIIYTPGYDSVYEYTSGQWFFVSILSPVSNQVYAWYANGKGAPVAYLALDTTGKSVTSANYLGKTVTGINEISDNSSAMVYPNPASSSINIVVKTASGNGYIKIIDLTGREIESASFNNGKAQFNTSGYADGMYLYLITNINGNLLDKGKFTVSH